MTEVVSVKFKTGCKNYYFSPEGIDISTGDWLVVETAKGMEMAQCSYGNHLVEDTSVVQPLRPVVRIATEDDFRVASINKKREAEAFDICKEKIEAHNLDMKLINVECNFEGNKITFFFTSDGRVDFRELVKDLASVFRTRIELRQIGIRDETKMLGGIGICGRPYCCHEFLDEFRPVSTKMAKIQSLSLNPAKISGSCGRLMCCLRYEQEAYEDLVKRVPKQGAFVETKDGFGTAVQINLLRQTVKVKLDDSSDDNLHLYKVNELCTVPGGRPPEGEAPEHIFEYVSQTEEETEEVAQWAEMMDEEFSGAIEAEAEAARPEKSGSGNHKKRKKNSGQKHKESENGKPMQKGSNRAEDDNNTAQTDSVKNEPGAKPDSGSGMKHKKPHRRHTKKPAGNAEVKPDQGQKQNSAPKQEKQNNEKKPDEPGNTASKKHHGRHHYYGHKKPAPKQQ